MIRFIVGEKKGKYEIIAVADHQKDLSNLRLMSYRLKGADKVNLNKDEYGGPYLKMPCDDVVGPGGLPDVAVIRGRAEELRRRYN